VAGVPGRSGAAGEVMSLGDLGHAHTHDRPRPHKHTDRKLEGTVGTVTKTTCPIPLQLPRYLNPCEKYVGSK